MNCFLTKKSRRIFNRWVPGISHTEDKIYMKTKVGKKVGKKHKTELDSASNMIIERMCNGLIKDSALNVSINKKSSSTDEIMK